MSIETARRPMTTEEFLALPDDGVDRDLIRGEIRVWGQSSEDGMTRRNRGHSRSNNRIGRFLDEWLDTQPGPWGEVLSGEAGVRIRNEPDTTFGIDVVYISAEVAAANPDLNGIINGVPTLAVEILSPSNTQAEIEKKIDEYLQAGVPLVWIANPTRRTILVHRPDAEPQLFNATQELTAEPHLPGFRVLVAKLFGR